MTQLPAHISPAHWMRQMFSAKAARDGGVIRRQVRDIERLIGRSVFEQEIRRRGYRAIENAGQFIILCNQDDVRLIE